MSNNTNVNSIFNWIPGKKLSFYHEDDQVRRFQSMNRPGRFPYFYRYTFHAVVGPDGDFIVADLNEAIKIQTDIESCDL